MSGRSSKESDTKLQSAETKATPDEIDNKDKEHTPTQGTIMHFSVSKDFPGFKKDQVMDAAKHPIQQKIVDMLRKILSECTQPGSPTGALQELVAKTLREKDESTDHWNQQIGKTWFPKEEAIVETLAGCADAWKDKPMCEGVHLCFDKQDKSLMLILDNTRLNKIGEGLMAGPPVENRDFWMRRNFGEIFPEVKPNRRVYGLVFAQLDPHNQTNYRANKPLESDVKWDTDWVMLGNTLALFFQNVDVYFPLIHYFRLHADDLEELMKLTAKRHRLEFDEKKKSTLKCHRAQKSMCAHCSLPVAGACSLFELEGDDGDSGKKKVVLCLACANKVFEDGYKEGEQFASSVTSHAEASLVEAEVLTKINGLVKKYDKSTYRDDELLTKEYWANSLKDRNIWCTSAYREKKPELEPMDHDDARLAFQKSTKETGAPDYFRSFVTSVPSGECYGDKQDTFTFRVHQVTQTSLRLHPPSRNCIARAPPDADKDVLRYADPCATWLVVPPSALAEVEEFVKKEYATSGQEISEVDLSISHLEAIQEKLQNRGVSLIDQRHKDMVVIPPGHTTATIYNCDHYQTFRFGVEKGTMSLVYLSYLLLAHGQGCRHLVIENSLNFLQHCIDQLLPKKEVEENDDEEDDDEENEDEEDDHEDDDKEEE